jgi:multicomponent Na+:H+ antiporter subunit E
LQRAWLAIRPGPPPRTAVLRAQLTIESDLVLALAVNIITLIPGSIVLEIDQERRLIDVHVIDVDSQESVARFHRNVARIERLLVATFAHRAGRPPTAKEDA